MAVQATFPEELSGLHDSDHCFLALLGDDENLDLSLLDIEDGIWASPCENTWHLSNFNMVLPSPTLARKFFGSNVVFGAFGMKARWGILLRV
jgi:hypothetical protein